MQHILSQNTAHHSDRRPKNTAAYAAVTADDDDVDYSGLMMELIEQ